MNSFIFLIPFLAFPLMWLFIVSLISRMSGWRTLARHYEYADHAAQPIVQLKWQSLSMGYAKFLASNYGRVVNIGSDGTYLYLSVMMFFRFGHAPLRIPFADINISDTKMNLFKSKCAVANKAPNVKIYMRGNLVTKIENLSYNSHPNSG